MRHHHHVRWALVALALSGSGSALFAAGTVQCGDVLLRSTRLSADLACPGTALTIAAPGVVLDCAGHTIRGTAPGSTGVDVEAARATIVGCTFADLTSGVAAQGATGAPGLAIRHDRFTNNNAAVSVVASPDIEVADDLFEGSSCWVGVNDSPRALIIRNEFRPATGRVGAVNLLGCPNSTVHGNQSANGIAIAPWRGSDGSVVAHNRLGTNGYVTVGFSSRVRVEHNVAGGAGHHGSAFGALLEGADECDVAHNDFCGVGVGIISVRDGTGLFGAEWNRIHDNRVSDSAYYGVLIGGGAHNVVERNVVERAEMALALFPDIEVDGTTVAATDNQIRRNLFDRGSWGIYVGNAGGNRFEDNVVRRFAVGVTDMDLEPGHPPNLFRGNVVADNGYFGFFAQGASPVITGNIVERNGRSPDSPGADLVPLGDLIGTARGGIGLFTTNGTDQIWDDGDPTNDLLAQPVIGSADDPNEFAENSFADIYALDTRPANASDLATSNRFDPTGDALRVRQDWYGLVRVRDEAGNPVAGADVAVSDALGAVVVSGTSGPDGVVPASCDPARPQGRLPLEYGGPTPAWPRLTEYVIDRAGTRIDLTPHQIMARFGESSGHATYAWTGCSDLGCDPIRRYQLADVPVP